MVLPESLKTHRMQTCDEHGVIDGQVMWEPIRSLWFSIMAVGAIVGGIVTFTWSAFALFVCSTAAVLLLGHSVGMHRKLIHNSFECPKWLEYLLVYFGVLVGLAGPLGLLRTHDLRDYAQRLPRCHDYLAHRRKPLLDFWWQIHCALHLKSPPSIKIEAGIEHDRTYQFLQRTWMLQQLPWALLFFAVGDWGFVFWGVCARVTAGIFGHWLIGYFAHNHGQMHHEVVGAAVQGHNVPYTALLTMGECWHNNHHAFPGSAKLGFQKGEWDPGWWLLLGLKRLGLVWELQTPETLPFRAELKKRSSNQSKPCRIHRLCQCLYPSFSNVHSLTLRKGLK